MRKEKGITLIALIITIIVMLILVAVTLSITLGENGIVKKAQSAKQQQEREVARERVQACLSFDSTGQVDIGETVASLQRAGGKITNSSATEITVEMDGYTFTISKNGNVVFEGTNGTHNHVDENNDGYCDNCGEYISNEGYGYTEEIIETGILDGTYYGGWDRGACYRISGNKLTFLGGGSGDEEYTFVLNENNNTIIINDNGDNEVASYEITPENKILIFNDGMDLYSTTEVGFEYSLDGEYINSESYNNHKFIFNSSTNTVQESSYNGSTWYITRGAIRFWGYNGTYYVSGMKIPSSDNYQSFTYYDTTYTKAN